MQSGKLASSTREQRQIAAGSIAEPIEKEKEFYRVVENKHSETFIVLPTLQLYGKNMQAPALHAAISYIAQSGLLLLERITSPVAFKQ